MVAVEVVVPVRYSAWMSGFLGGLITASVRRELERHCDEDVEVQAVLGGLVVRSAAEIGVVVARVFDAVRATNEEVARRFPVFTQDLGCIFSGTVQVTVRAKGGGC